MADGSGLLVFGVAIIGVVAASEWWHRRFERRTGLWCPLCAALRLLESVLLGTGSPTRWARRAGPAPDDVWHAVTDVGNRWARTRCGAALRDVEVDVTQGRPKGRKCEGCQSHSMASSRA